MTDEELLVRHAMRIALTPDHVRNGENKVTTIADIGRKPARQEPEIIQCAPPNATLH
jgi:hypothetical protein